MDIDTYGHTTGSFYSPYHTLHRTTPDLLPASYSRLYLPLPTLLPDYPLIFDPTATRVTLYVYTDLFTHGYVDCLPFPRSFPTHPPYDLLLYTHVVVLLITVVILHICCYKPYPDYDFCDLRTLCTFDACCTYTRSYIPHVRLYRLVIPLG